MSEFKQLVQTWHDIYARHLDHRDECLALAKKLHEKILRDWHWPEEFVAIYRLGRDWADPVEQKRIIREALDIEEDGSWFFGLELMVPTRHSMTYT
jgi:hypothetical protein